ncbi:murein L,D-transpeptidase catalytic domain family protein [Lutibacter sp.]|uniref:murein L,D-transpeptidase catalytic domain family protein n=1 Tax=Lutibacter sp. TaxID=1925666 RepID=UPI003568431E
MTYKTISLLLIGFFSFITNPSFSNKVPSPKLELANVSNNMASKAEIRYNSLVTNNFKLPKIESFTKALQAFNKLKESGRIQKNILTLVDFSLSSNENRLWVIDLNKNTILFQSLVAHGRNSGNEFADDFSNIPESHQSSLGLYLTGETYIGKHGYSLRLDGQEKGINSNARNRAIVIHGADYVSENFIKKHGRLGRSFGCPSLPNEVSKEIIDVIKDKSGLFVYYPS